MINFITVDLGQKFGVCSNYEFQHSIPRGLTQSHSFLVPTNVGVFHSIPCLWSKSFNMKEMEGFSDSLETRFNVWSTCIEDIFNAMYRAGPFRVFYEYSPFGKGMGAEMILGYRSIMLDRIVKMRLGSEQVYPNTLKKQTTGYGKATKPQMKRAIGQLIGQKITDDNEADAIAIAFWALRNSQFFKPDRTEP